MEDDYDSYGGYNDQMPEEDNGPSMADTLEAGATMANSIKTLKGGGEAAKGTADAAKGLADAGKGATEAAKAAGGAAEAAKGAAAGAKGGGGGGKAAAIGAAAGAADTLVDKALGDKSGAGPQEGEKVADPNAPKETDEDGNPIDDGSPKEGDKVAPGKKVNEDGEVEKTSTAKTAHLAATAIGAYFGGKSGAEAGEKIGNSKTMGRLTDVVDKVPGVKQATNELDESGALDVGEGAIKAYKGITSGDKEQLDQAKKDIKKGTKKAVKKQMKMLLLASLPILLPMIFGMFILISIAAAFSEEEDTSTKEVYENMHDYEWDTVDPADPYAPDPGGDPYQGGGVSIDQILARIPNFESLSPQRQGIIRAAAEVVAVGTHYSWGGHPSGPGLSGIPKAGLDCGGFVMYSLWTGLGSSPGYLTTRAIRSGIGSKFIQINCSQALPGDVGLNSHHTGIYAGNSRWLHAESRKTGTVFNGYKSFTTCLRYKGVPTT